MRENKFYNAFLEGEIADYRTSEKRRDAISAMRYYRGDHDIKRRCRTAIGADGGTVGLDSLPCSRIVNNQYGRIIDQKVNYSLGRPLTVDTEDEGFAAALKVYFTGGGQRLLRRAAVDAMNCGVGFIHPYIDGHGELKMKLFDPALCIPLWADEEHETLDAFIRIVPSEKYEGRQKKAYERIFVYTRSGIEEFGYVGSRLSAVDLTPYHFKGADGTPYLWDRVPIIPVKYNYDGVPMIRRAKSLQDAINEIMSDFCDNMAENSRNTVLVLKNFDGEDLGEFRRNLAVYGAVKVRSDMGGEGGVESLRIEVNSENYESLLAALTEALIECTRGFDSHDSRLGSNPNRMNVLAIYSDIDLDANGFETELGCTFDEIISYVRSYLYFTGRGDYRSIPARIRISRDLLVSEAQTIDSIEASRGIVSERTLIASHPMVDDVEEELSRLRREEKKKEESL